MNSLLKKKQAFLSIPQQSAEEPKGYERTVSGTPPIKLTDVVDNNSMIDYTLTGNVSGGMNIVATGKNLFDASFYVAENLKSGSAAAASGLSHKLNDDGTISITLSNYNIVHFEPTDINKKLQAGKTYTISVKGMSATGTGTSTSGRLGIWFNKSSATYCYWRPTDFEGTENAFSTKITVPDDWTECFYFTFYCGTDVTVTWRGIQIEESTVATEYEVGVTEEITIDTELNGTLNYKADKLPKLPTFEGTTQYFVQAETQPIDLSVKYYSKTEG